jgi:two-component system nitrate/nitrite response regulator NarL
MSQAEPSVILIVGGAPLIGAGLKKLLLEAGCFTRVESVSVARLSTGVATLPHPQMVIVDSGDCEGDFAICSDIKGQFPEARLVILADDCSLEMVASAFDAGVDGYFSRDAACETMVNAVRLVLSGEKFMPASAFCGLSALRSNGVGGVWDAGADGRQLSHREVDILALVSRGEPNKEIAWRLAITESTVKVHIKAILRKLNMRNRTQAAIWAIARGIGAVRDDSQKLVSDG